MHIGNLRQGPPRAPPSLQVPARHAVRAGAQLVGGAGAHDAAALRPAAREREILALLAPGCDSAQISEELYISQNTVRSHIHNLCRKTGTANRGELAGLIERA